MEPLILKGTTTTKYIEYKHKNTGTSSIRCTYAWKEYFMRSNNTEVHSI